MLHQLGSGLVQHPGLWARFEIPVHQTINPSLAYILVEPPLVDHAPQITARTRPVPLLDNTTVHIDK